MEVGTEQFGGATTKRSHVNVFFSEIGSRDEKELVKRTANKNQGRCRGVSELPPAAPSRLFVGWAKILRDGRHQPPGEQFSAPGCEWLEVLKSLDSREGLQRDLG